MCKRGELTLLVDRRIYLQDLGGRWLGRAQTPNGLGMIASELCDAWSGSLPVVSVKTKALEVQSVMPLEERYTSSFNSHRYTLYQVIHCQPSTLMAGNDTSTQSYLIQTSH